MNYPQNKKIILGVNVSPLTYKLTLKTIGEYVAKRKKGYICASAVHLIMECQKNKLLRQGVNGATLVTPDGMPLVRILQSRGLSTERIYGPDLMVKTCELAALKKWRIYLLGGSAGQSKTLQTKLLSIFPSLQIAGAVDTSSLPLTGKRNQKVIDEINSSRASVVFIGMGCPTQELWMINNREALKPNILIGVGAAFDFISQNVKQAPEWMRNIGFEWFFRLIQEPGRLWKRYLLYNFRFVLLIIKEQLTMS